MVAASSNETASNKPLDANAVTTSTAAATANTALAAILIDSNLVTNQNNSQSQQSEGMLEEGRVVTVRDLLKGLYEKACQQKLWGLVRHTAGMLGKRVEDLAKAVTDLLVRQKQVQH